MKQRKILIAVMLLMLLFMLSVAMAQNKIPAQSLSNGCVITTNSTNRLNCALGQPVIGKSANNSSLTFSGFYYTGVETGAAGLPTNWQVLANTGNSATIIIPVSISPSLDGMPLQTGDYIGVFTPAGLCCGRAPWLGTNFSLTIWGDNEQTPDVDGIKNGETLEFRLFRVTTQKEYTAVKVEYSKGDGKYQTNAIFELSLFQGGSNTPAMQTITLRLVKGWNLFSINVSPVNPAIKDLFASVTADVEIIKNTAGKSYMPKYPIDQIGSLNYKEGYMAFMKNSANVDIIGTGVNPLINPILLARGWSLISFLPTTAMNATKAFASIVSNLLIAKDNFGKNYLPTYGINSLTQMQAGQGYWVCLNAADTLLYPATALARINSLQDQATEEDTTKWFKFKSNTGANATIVVPLDCNPRYSDGTPLNNNDEIGVFNHKGAKGVCAGAIVWKKENAAITIWGENVKYDSTAIGLKNHDSLQFRVWKSGDREYNATASCLVDSLFYSENSIIVLSNLVVDLSKPTAVLPSLSQPQDFRLIGNFPNPFNPETTIRYELPSFMRVRAEIYDLLGKRICLLLDQPQEAGQYNIKWKGVDDYGNKTASGVYICRLTANNKVSNLKMLLLK